MGNGRCYDNRFESVLLFRARSNTLQLGDRNRFSGGEVRCELCRLEREDLGHFILRCPEMLGVRRRDLLEEIGGEEEREQLGKLLFMESRIEEVKKMLGDMWRLRGCLIARNRREREERPLAGLES